MAETTEISASDESLSPEESSVSHERHIHSVRQIFRIEGGRLVPTDQSQPQIIAYNAPTIDDEKDLQELHNIDYHTLQSSLDPDELSRLEFEPDHAAMIFKRPKSFCADDNFLLKVTSTGIFLYDDYLVVVMPDDAPLFEGRVPFPIETLQDVILRLLYQSIMHFEGHLKAISMLSDSLERRISVSLENRYLLNMFALEKSLVYILNSINSNGALLDRMKIAASKLGFDREQVGVLEDIIIENQQCFRRAEIYAQIIASLMDARASLVNNNLNQLMKKFTIVMLAVMMPTMITALFSMNVDLPIPREVQGWAFWAISLTALGSSFGVLFMWRVKKW